MYRKSCFLVLFCELTTVLLCLSGFVHMQLIINVKNQGGDIIQENILANTSDDTISLEFQRSDGTLVTQLIDFRNEVQILKTLILGEEERGQSQYQVICFVFHYAKDSFISSEAMSKLRQKNPGTIRIPEDDLGHSNYSMDYFIVLKNSAVISPHIMEICNEAKDATYTRHQDVINWATIQGIHEMNYVSALKKFPNRPSFIEHQKNNEVLKNVTSCTGLKKMVQPCECHLETCIGWYPCGLKYCKSKTQGKNSETMSYRCGIKTCKQCFQFNYYVNKKEFCLWDD